MGLAAHWSKFTATASVGMIHNKHLSDSMNILSRYLPGSGGGPYQEGGALYALKAEEEEDSDNEWEEVEEEVIESGIGPSASDILTEIRNVLFQDRAVPWEAAGLSIGLILCGSGNNQWYAEMMAYSHETQHEKIQRELVVGISIIFYNLQELINDKSETIRFSICCNWQYRCNYSIITFSSKWR